MSDSKTINRVLELLKTNGLTTPPEKSEIETRLDKLSSFGVNGTEAVRSVTNYFLKASGIGTAKSIGGETTDCTIEAAKVKDKWVNLKVQVARLFENDNEKIAQSGIIGDATGSMAFTAWAKSNLPRMEEGKSYQIKNAVVDVYNDRFSVKLNKTTIITEIDEKIEAVQPEVIMAGAIVGLQVGSGLIKRCPICKKRLAKGIGCEDHGKVEGTYDMRIKAVLDNGEVAKELIIGKDLTETISGLTMDKAKHMAMEALDNEVVSAWIATKIVGKYVIVKGSDMGRAILVTTFDLLPMMNQSEIKAIVAETDGI